MSRRPKRGSWRGSRRSQRGSKQDMDTQPEVEADGDEIIKKVTTFLEGGAAASTQLQNEYMSLLVSLLGTSFHHEALSLIDRLRPAPNAPPPPVSTPQRSQSKPPSQWVVGENASVPGSSHKPTDDKGKILSDTTASSGLPAMDLRTGTQVLEKVYRTRPLSLFKAQELREYRLRQQLAAGSARTTGRPSPSAPLQQQLQQQAQPQSSGTDQQALDSLRQAVVASEISHHVHAAHGATCNLEAFVHANNAQEEPLRLVEAAQAVVADALALIPVDCGSSAFADSVGPIKLAVQKVQERLLAATPSETTPQSITDAYDVVKQAYADVARVAKALFAVAQAISSDHVETIFTASTTAEAEFITKSIIYAWEAYNDRQVHSPSIANLVAKARALYDEALRVAKGDQLAEVSCVSQAAIAVEDALKLILAAPLPSTALHAAVQCATRTCLATAQERLQSYSSDTTNALLLQQCVSQLKYAMPVARRMAQHASAQATEFCPREQLLQPMSAAIPAAVCAAFPSQSQSHHPQIRAACEARNALIMELGPKLASYTELAACVSFDGIAQPQPSVTLFAQHQAIMDLIGRFGGGIILTTGDKEATFSQLGTDLILRLLNILHALTGAGINMSKEVKFYKKEDKVDLEIARMEQFLRFAQRLRIEFKTERTLTANPEHDKTRKSFSQHLMQLRDMHTLILDRTGVKVMVFGALYSPAALYICWVKQGNGQLYWHAVEPEHHMEALMWLLCRLVDAPILVDEEEFECETGLDIPLVFEDDVHDDDDDDDDDVDEPSSRSSRRRFSLRRELNGVRRTQQHHGKGSQQQLNTLLLPPSQWSTGFSQQKEEAQANFNIRRWHASMCR